MKLIKKYLLLICFTSFIYTEVVPYVSPGIQIGINSMGSFFFSIQVTGGIFPNINNAPIAIGTTIGKRYIYNPITKRFDGYRYLDGQVSLLVLGIGFGSIGKKTETKFYNQNGIIEKQITKENYTKYKLWIGSIGLLSYDYIAAPAGRHNFGLFGILPIPYSNDIINHL